MLVTLIIPCYNEAETLEILHNKLEEVTEKLSDYQFEYLFINDGSKDDTLSIIKSLADVNSKVKYVSFSRNFGKEAAMYAGFCNAKGDLVAVMDADMQDPPELLGDMLRIITEEGYDSVATRRVSREGEPIIRSFCARMFYKLINKVSDVDIVDGARDYRLMTRPMVDAIVSMSEYNRFSKGIFGWIGFDTYWYPYENVERVAGETKWSFFKLFKYSIEGIVSFSQVPLSLATYTGIFFAFVALMGMLFIFIRALVFGDPVSGWPSLACIITLLGGIQLLCIGIMGQYLSKTYMEVKNRPHYIVKDTNL